MTARYSAKVTPTVQSWTVQNWTGRHCPGASTTRRSTSASEQQINFKKHYKLKSGQEKDWRNGLTPSL
jgi:hypothetical protein